MITSSHALNLMELIDQQEPGCNVSRLGMALHDDPDNRTLAGALFDAWLERGVHPDAAQVLVDTAAEVGRDARDIPAAVVALGTCEPGGSLVRAAILRRHPIALHTTPIDVVGGSAASRLIDPDGSSGDRVRYLAVANSPTRRGWRRVRNYLERLRITIGARRVLELQRVIWRDLVR